MGQPRDEKSPKPGPSEEDALLGGLTLAKASFHDDCGILQHSLAGFWELAEHKAKDIIQLRNVLFKQLEHLIEHTQDAEAKETILNIHKKYRDSIEDKSEQKSLNTKFATALKTFATLKKNPIPNQDALKKLQEKELSAIGECLRLFKKQKKQEDDILITLNELFLKKPAVAASLQDDLPQIITLLKEIQKPYDECIEEISSHIFHPRALKVDDKLKKLQEQVHDISVALKLIDREFLELLTLVDDEKRRQDIQEFRATLPSLLLNGTIHQSDLEKVTQQVKDILTKIKENEPETELFIRAIATQIDSLQKTLNQWKLTGPEYYASLLVKYGAPIALGALSIVIPVIPMEALAIPLSEGATAAMLTKATESATALSPTTVDKAINFTLNKKPISHRGKEDKHVGTAHIAKKESTLSVESKHLWQETIFKEWVTKWIMENKLDAAMTVACLTATAVTTPLTLTGVLAPASALIIVTSVAGVKLAAKLGNTIHDAQKLSQAEDRLIAMTLENLATHQKNFSAWQHSKNPAPLSAVSFIASSHKTPEQKNYAIKNLHVIRKSLLHELKSSTESDELAMLKKQIIEITTQLILSGAETASKAAELLVQHKITKDLEEASELLNPTKPRPASMG